MKDYEFINEQNKKLQEQDKKAFKAHLRHERVKSIIYITLTIIVLTMSFMAIRKQTMKDVEKCMKKGNNYNYCLYQAQ